MAEPDDPARFIRLEWSIGLLVHLPRVFDNPLLCWVVWAEPGFAKVLHGLAGVDHCIGMPQETSIKACDR